MSGLVVKVFRVNPLTSLLSFRTLNSTAAPADFPIQLRCVSFRDSLQSKASNPFKSLCFSSAETNRIGISVNGAICF